MVDKSQIISAMKDLGIKESDSILVHSSLKSFGCVDGGANTVISALLKTVENVTLVMPSFCQKKFRQSL